MAGLTEECRDDVQINALGWNCFINIYAISSIISQKRLQSCSDPIRKTRMSFGSALTWRKRDCWICLFNTWSYTAFYTTWIWKGVSHIFINLHPDPFLGGLFNCTFNTKKINCTTSYLIFAANWLIRSIKTW